MMILLEVSRTVHYSQEVEVPDAQAEQFQEVYEAGDKQAIQEFLDSRINPREVVDADEFEVLNVVFNY